MLACVVDVVRPAALLAPGDADDGPDPSPGDRLRRGGVCCAAGLKDAVDLHIVREDLARVVQTALEPAHISVWTSRRE